MEINFWIILLQIIITFLGAFLFKYIKQKADNQADKEDLKKLTTIVEEVKKKNNEEVELLKTNLDIISNREKEIFNEEKLAIIDFFTQLNRWIWGSMNVYLNDFNHTNYKNIDNDIDEIRNSYKETQIAYGKVKLLISDKDLIIKGHYLIKNTLELHHFVEEKLQRLKDTLSYERTLVDQITRKGFDFEKMSDEMKDFYKSSSKENKKERDEILNEFYVGHSENWDKVVNELQVFQDSANEYLKK